MVAARESIGLLILRLGTGGLLVYGHGWSKLVHFGERLATFADPIGLGPQASFVLVVFAEVVCSLLVMLGLFTRLAVVPLLIFFVVAAFVQHGHDPWSRRELPLLFGLPYLTLLFTGPGRYALDAQLRLGWRRRAR
jgi:putative oxidoreductase